MILLLSIVLAAAVSSAEAADAPTRRTVTLPAVLVVKNGNKPGDPTNCSAVIFGMWKHEPGTVAATVAYRRRGQDRSKSATPPFHDTYTKVARYRAPAGYHWIKLGATWADSRTPNDCSKYVPRYKELYEVDAVAELTLSETPDCLHAKRFLGTWVAVVAKLERQLGMAPDTKTLSPQVLEGRPDLVEKLTRLKEYRTERALWASRVDKLC